LRSISNQHLDLSLRLNGTRGVAGLNKYQVESIAGTLRDLGVAPNSFDWKLVDTGPYPGLRALQEGDEAILFGRDLEIRNCIRYLEELNDRISNRTLIIQAPSGAGKSSFLRAGLWRRLRGHAGFTPLCIVRAKHGVVRNQDWGFVSGLFQKPANHLKLSRQEIEERVTEDLLGLLMDIADADKLPGVPRRTLLIGIDQAEEVASLTPDETEELEYLLRIVLFEQNDIKIRLVLTLRDDSVDSVVDRLYKLGLKYDSNDYYRLSRLPSIRFRDVILGPAAVARRASFELKIDQPLAEALATAAGESGAEIGDALPVLALALHRMVEKCRAPDGRITLAPVDAKAFLEAAVADTARDAIKIAGADESMLRRLVIPRLATWDMRASSTGSARRQPATESDLFDGQRGDLRQLATALVEQRLLTRSRTDAGAIYEIAHEALLRVAPPRDLIVELRAKFLLADVLKLEAREWIESRHNEERLARRGERLREAVALVEDPDFGPELLRAGLKVREYLDNCSEKEVDEARQREQLRAAQLQLDLRARIETLDPGSNIKRIRFDEQLREVAPESCVVFVSHSSDDDAYASALDAWLHGNGFTDVFIDHGSFAGGDKWREALRASAGSARVVVCLVTRHWLASRECFNDFGVAWYMGKRIIPLLLLGASANLDTEGRARLARVLDEDQGIDLAP
jgi:TIR domain